MPLYKNVASQKIPVFAWDTANDAPKTGNAAAITAQISKDGGACAATNDTNPTELDATDAPGIYIFDMLQAETNADMVVLFAKSSTADITLEPVILWTDIQQTGDAYAIVNSGTYGNDALKTLSTAIKAKTDNLPGSPAAVGSAMTLHADYDAAKTAASVTDIFTYVVENSKSFVEVIRVMLSRLVGKANGGGTDTIIFRDDADTKDRITMTVDANGNRSAVVKDGS
jgi:hypothetical protein